jgi:muramoyltetrapeptide carboxypeptidase
MSPMVKRLSGLRGRRSNLRQPARLRPGAVIGIAAPASPFQPEALRSGVEVLRSMGFDVVVPEGVFARLRHLAGTDAERAALLESLMLDDRVDAVMCARGGYGCLRILPLLDYPAMAARPKPLIGFSDVTALLAAVGERCNMVTFHGPLVTTLPTASERTVQSFRDALMSAEPATYRLGKGTTLRAGTAAGPVCGGNLTTLCHLVGTPYMPRFRSRILFLEDRGEAPYRIDRMLAHLKTAGCLEGLRGLVLGSFEDCGPPGDVLEVADDLFRGTGFPILAGFEAGHTDPNLTIPFGSRAVLDAGEGILCVDPGTCDP